LSWFQLALDDFKSMARTWSLTAHEVAPKIAHDAE
jgi:hypothetical protein